MKNFFFICFICLLPCFALAQDDSPVLEDFYSGTKDITNVIRLDDHINVIQINTSNDSFDLVAVNDDMQVLWNTTINGYGICVGKYKNKVAAIAATEHGSLKGNGNTYKALIIDPANGNTLAEKVIYQDNNDFIEVPKVLIDEDYFKFAIRQSDVTRKLHVGVPLFFIFQMSSWIKESIATQKLEIIDLDEHLNKIDSVNAVVNGAFINITCNKKGDMFISWLNGPVIEVYKYGAGKSAPSMQLNADVAIKPSDEMNLGDMILFAPSKTEPDNLYYSLIYLNEAKDPEMMLGKMNFSNGTKQSVTTVFKKDDIKSIEKSYVSIDKKLDDPDLGTPKYLQMRSLLNTDNGVMVILKGFESNSSGGVSEKSSLINAFDADLKSKFEQIFPDSRRTGAVESDGYCNFQNKLYMVGNTKKSGLYGVLDLNTGQWDKIVYLSRENVKGGMELSNILWFGNDFIIPYAYVSSGAWSSSYNYKLSLQQVQY